jgi:hypothetical protein
MLAAAAYLSLAIVGVRYVALNPGLTLPLGSLLASIFLSSSLGLAGTTGPFRPVHDPSVAKCGRIWAALRVKHRGSLAGTALIGYALILCSQFSHDVRRFRRDCRLAVIHF